MSKRVPTVPTQINTEAMKQYVQDVRTYARSEFSKGHNDLDVISRLKKEGMVAAASKHVADEYLDFLGIDEAKRKSVIFYGMVVAMAVYAVLSMILLKDQMPGIRVGFSMMVAASVGMATSSVLRSSMRKAAINKPKR